MRLAFRAEAQLKLKKTCLSYGDDMFAKFRAVKVWQWKISLLCFEKNLYIPPPSYNIYIHENTNIKEKRYMNYYAKDHF